MFIESLVTFVLTFVATLKGFIARRQRARARARMQLPQKFAFYVINK